MLLSDQITRLAIPQTRSKTKIRQRRSRCITKAEQLPSDGSLKQTSKAEMLARIKKAKEYATEPEKQDPVLQSFDEYAKKQAEDEQAAFLQAQSELSTSTTTANSPPSPPTIEAASNDVIARLNRAKQYKQNLPSEPSTTLSPSDGPPQNTTPTSSQTQQEQPLQDDREFRQGSGSANEAANWLKIDNSQGTAEGLDTSMRAEEFTIAKEDRTKQSEIVIETAKSAVTSTSYRRRAEVDYGLAQQQDDAELQMEKDTAYAGIPANLSSVDYTSEMDEATAIDDQQQQIDAATGTEASPSDTATTGDTEQQQGKDVHNPAVATWGVFPRPKNISQAYGGGRNLRPGQALETEEAAEERKERIGKALSAYKKSLGLDVDPVIEQKAQMAFDEGEILFKAGNLNAALVKYTESSELMPLKSRLGGQSTLQRAICLDSLGKNQDALTLYKKLKSHSAPGVSKTARRMMFGFEAADELKLTSTPIYRDDRKADWSKYFDRINSGGWAMYTPPKDGNAQEDDEGSAKIAAVMAAGVVLLPLAMLGYYIVFK